MQGTKRNVLFFILLWISSHLPPLSLSGRSEHGVAPARRQVTFENCHDGDTCRVSDERGVQMKIRFSGIDAPEISPPRRAGKGQVYALEARDFLKKLVLGKKLWIEILGNDRYGRYLALVFRPESKISVNEDLVQGGYAYAYRGKQENSALAQRLRNVEELARVARRGFWGLATPPEDPSLFRHRSP